MPYKETDMKSYMKPYKGGDTLTYKRFTEESYSKFKRKMLQQLGFINSELRRGEALPVILQRCNISLEDFELIGWGYKEETKQIGKFKEVTFEDVAEMGLVEEVQVSVPQLCDNSMALQNIDSEQLQNLLNSYQDIMDMLELFKQNKMLSDENKGIVIELPFDEDKQFKGTFRMNKIIYEQFKEFCKLHKEYTTKDLISMALKEYMEKYS